MAKCNDPEVGVLLPAYELQALTEEDLKRFEIHMMHCQYCFNEVREFQKWSQMLLSSNLIKESVALATTADHRAKTSSKSIKVYLWPDIPIVFRPALYMILLLLMIIPSYLGLKQMFGDDQKIRPVQKISLVSTRTVNNNVLSIGTKLDGLISFAVPDPMAIACYRITISDENGAIIMQDDNFNNISRSGMGEIIFPHVKMRTGTYHLTVTPFPVDSRSEKREYPFRIEK